MRDQDLQKDCHLQISSQIKTTLYVGHSLKCSLLTMPDQSWLNLLKTRASIDLFCIFHLSHYTEILAIYFFTKET